MNILTPTEYPQFKEKMLKLFPDDRIERIPPTHPTNDLQIDGEWVKVDREIIPLIWFFNQQSDTKTQFSCHGSTKEELEKYQEVRMPYILFTSKNYEFLNRIAKTVHEMNFEVDETYRTKVDKDFNWRIWISVNFYETLRYFLEFSNQESMVEFTERLTGE